MEQAILQVIDLKKTYMNMNKKDSVLKRSKESPRMSLLMSIAGLILAIIMGIWGFQRFHHIGHLKA